MYNVNTSRPLIPREQTYVLDRKLVTIHSDDRDIKKWPFSNHFEVELPQTMENVESMRLVEIQLPVVHPTFKNDYQNTKLSFKIRPNTTSDPNETPELYHQMLLDHYNDGGDFTITIQEGYYCPEELAMELQDRMNQAVSDFIILNWQTYWPTADLSEECITPPAEYLNMRVFFDKVSMRYWFGNIIDGFELLFNKREEYILDNCEQPDMWEKYNRWGLPAYLGYDRELYTSIPSLNNDDDPDISFPTPIKFAYMGRKGIWMCPTAPDLPVHYVKGPMAPFLTGERSIYMECKKYNSYDELKPYVQNTNSAVSRGYDYSQLYQSRCTKGNKAANCVVGGAYDYNGYVNAAFAKIPVKTTPMGELVDSRNGFLQNVTMFDVPEEKISKLEVKFRYHDGRLVDFGNIPFDFTIEFNQLKNEIQRSYQVRIPNSYRL